MAQIITNQREKKLTAESDIVVVVQLVDSVNLTTNVVILSGLVQVLDGGVLRVTTEDELALLGPK